MEKQEFFDVMVGRLAQKRVKNWPYPTGDLLEENKRVIYARLRRDEENWENIKEVLWDIYRASKIDIFEPKSWDDTFETEKIKNFIGDKVSINSALIAYEIGRGR